MATQLGAHNPRLAATRKLLEKKGRTESGRFLFEGPTLLAEALRSGCNLQEIYATEIAYSAAPDVAKCEAQGTPVFLVDEPALKRLSDVETPSGIVAVAQMRLSPLAALLEGDDRILLLAGVTDPGNAGTLLRTAEAFGIGKAIFGAGGVEPHHPKVVRAAMGSLFRLALAATDPPSFASAARAADRPVVGTSPSGTPLHEFRFPERAIIAIGSERQGLEAWTQALSARVAVPIVKGVESLNAGIAGAIVLYASAAPFERD